MSMQVIYVSSRADEALLEALRREPFPDAQHEPHEVSSQVAMLLQDCVTRVQSMLRNSATVHIRDVLQSQQALLERASALWEECT